MKALIVDTFNGEGYSEPTIKVSNVRSSVEALEIIDDMRLSYGDDFIEKEIDGDNKGDVILTLDDGEDQGAIHIMDLPTSEFYILKIDPQVNDVKFYAKMPTMEKALETLKDIIEDESTYGWDECDVEDYDGEDFFGSHADNLDCNFYYFKIVQG